MLEFRPGFHMTPNRLVARHLLQEVPHFTAEWAGKGRALIHFRRFTGSILALHGAGDPYVSGPRRRSPKCKVAFPSRRAAVTSKALSETITAKAMEMPRGCRQDL